MSYNLVSGTTVRAVVTFRDYSSQGLGAAIDPDSNQAVVVIYNDDEESIGAGSAIREGIGVYHYDWTLPSEEGIYYIEMKGLFGGEPDVVRQKVHVKFNTSQ